MTWGIGEKIISARGGLSSSVIVIISILTSQAYLHEITWFIIFETDYSVANNMLIGGFPLKDGGRQRREN